MVLPMDWNVEGGGKAIYVAIALVSVNIFSMSNRNRR